MEFLRNYFSETIIEAFGWTLFHSLWQAGVVAVILFIVLFFFKKQASHVRYLLSLIALFTLLAWSAVTFKRACIYANSKQNIARSVLENPEELKNIFKERLLEEKNSQTNISKAQTKLRWIKFRAFMQRNFASIYFLWSLGVLFFLIRMLVGMFYLHRFKTKSILKLGNQVQETIFRLKESLGIKQRIESFQSALVQVPMVVGYLKPVILVPASLITGLSPKELEAVFAHELAHIKRHDYLLNIVQSVIETIYFFHPAVWLISKFIRTERENSCDELALEVTGDKISYLKALTTAQELQTGKYQDLSMAFSGSKGSLLQRVIRIKNFNTMKKGVTEGFIAAAIIFISLILLSFSIDGRNLKREEVLQFESEQGISGRDVKKQAGLHLKPLESRDSIDKKVMVSIEEMEDFPEEMMQVVEMAYTSNDANLADLVQQSLELAKTEVKMAEIMKQVDSALNVADINAEIADAFAEARMELADEYDDSVHIAVEAIEIASKTIEAIDVSGIVTMAMEQATEALESINLDAIIEEAMTGVHEALENIDMEEIMREAMEAKEEAVKAHRDIVIVVDDYEESEDSEKSKEKKLEDKLRELEEGE